MLQPLIEDDVMVGFELPSLTSLRCDMMKKVGELDREKEFVPSRDLNDETKNSSEQESTAEATKGTEAPSNKKTQTKSSSESGADSKHIRDSLNL